MRRAGILMVIAALVATEAACGKKGTPQPPLRVRPAQVEGLRIRQRGDGVVLTLLEPKKRTDGTDFEEDVVLRLSLVPDDAAPAPGLRGRKARASAALKKAQSGSWVVPRGEWGKYRVEKRLEISLSLASLGLKPKPGAASLAGRKVGFVAEVQEGARKRSVLTPPVSIAICDPPAAPANLEARPAPSGILVSWESPGAATAAPVHLYRASGTGALGERPYRTLPPQTRSYLDDEAAAGAAYRYQVRFGAGDDPMRCESAAPADAETRNVDSFPPAPPVGLAAAAEESLIRLFWTPGPEHDLAGYILYRRDGPDEEFHPLTPSPIASTTYADTNVVRGRRYTYVVTAVDAAVPPNQSAWSEPAEEILP